MRVKSPKNYPEINEDEAEEDFDGEENYFGKKLSMEDRKTGDTIYKILSKSFNKVVYRNHPLNYVYHLMHNERETAEFVMKMIQKEIMTVIIFEHRKHKELIIIEPTEYYSVWAIRHIKKNHPHQWDDWRMRKEMTGYQ